jgi:hypothetical protein
VVYDGNPLDIKSKVEITIIDGEVVFQRVWLKTAEC